jgi:hypothetical protein
LDAAGHEFLDQRRGAAKRHVVHADLGVTLVDLARQVHHAARPCRSVEEPLRCVPALCESREFLEVLHGDGGMRDHHHRHVCGKRNRREIGKVVLGPSGILERGGRRGEGEVVEQERVAVRIRLCDRVRADRSSRPAHVLHDDVLTERRGEPLGEDARQKVRGAASRERNDHPDRA